MSGLSRELQIHLNSKILKTFFPPFTFELFLFQKQKKQRAEDGAEEGCQNGG